MIGEVLIVETIQQTPGGPGDGKEGAGSRGDIYADIVEFVGLAKASGPDDAEKVHRVAGGVH